MKFAHIWHFGSEQCISIQDYTTQLLFDRNCRNLHKNLKNVNLTGIDVDKTLLKKAPGCKVIDTQKNGGYITPLEAEGSYLTYISRIRKDNSNKKALNLWVVSDNLLKGAALNTVQIAEVLIKKYIK